MTITIVRGEVATDKIDGSAITGIVPIANGGTGAPSLAALALGSSTATTQSATDNSTKLANTAFVTTAVANAIAAVNPAVAVQAATTQASNTSGLTYNNGVSGIGAFFTGSVNTAITWDGYTFTAVGQRGLVKNDTQSPSGAYNGVYYVTQIQTGILPPILTRALDYDAPSDMNNTGAIPVTNGTINGSTSWVQTSQVTTVGTDPVTFAQFTYAPTTLITTSTSAGGALNGTYPNPTIGALGTPTSGILTNCSALPIGTGLTGATSNQLVTGTVGGGLQPCGIVVSAGTISQFQVAIQTKADSYTLTSADSGSTIYFTNSSAAILTCPKTMPVGYTVEVIQNGTAQVTFTAGASAAVFNRQTQTKTNAQYAAVRLVVLLNADGTNAQYNLAGDTGT